MPPPSHASPFSLSLSPSLSVQAVATYFHPSNSGRWCAWLGAFMNHLCYAFARRVGAERGAAAAGASTAGHTTVAERQEFVDIVLPLVLQGMYSKLQSMQLYCQNSLKHLAAVAPNVVLEAALPMVQDALDPGTLSETHKAPAALMVTTWASW